MRRAWTSGPAWRWPTTDAAAIGAGVLAERVGVPVAWLVGPMLAAFLATTPGGIDAATIAALETGANAPVVLAVQLVRFLVLVVAGPPVVRRLVGRQAG